MKLVMNFPTIRTNANIRIAFASDVMNGITRRQEANKESPIFRQKLDVGDV